MTDVYSSPNGTHSLNQAIDVEVNAARHVAVALILASGTASAGACTAIGTLETLQ